MAGLADDSDARPGLAGWVGLVETAGGILTEDDPGIEAVAEALGVAGPFPSGFSDLAVTVAEPVAGGVLPEATVAGGLSEDGALELAAAGR